MMPNRPQAIQMFYALNEVGGSKYIHPPSRKELEFYLNVSNSVSLLTLDRLPQT